MDTTCFLVGKTSDLGSSSLQNDFLLPKIWYDKVVIVWTRQADKSTLFREQIENESDKNDVFYKG